MAERLFGYIPSQNLTLHAQVGLIRWKANQYVLVLIAPSIKGLWGQL